MFKKNDIQKSMFLFFSFISGLGISFSLYNRFVRPADLSKTVELASIAVLFVLAGAAAWFLQQHIITGWIKTVQFSALLTGMVMCLVGSALVINALPSAAHIPATDRVLEINAEAGQTTLHEDSGIWLLEIKDNLDAPIPFELLEMQGSWAEKDGFLVSDGRQDSSLKYRFRTSGGKGQSFKLLFNAHPGAAPVRIQLDGTSITENMDEDSISNYQVDVPVRVNPLYATVIYGIEIYVLAFILFVFMILSINWIKKSPKIALSVLIVLDAALIAIVVSSSGNVAEQISNPVVRADFERFLWWPLFFWSAVLSVVCYRFRQHLATPIFLLPFVISMTVCFGLLANWNTFLVAPDSIGYVNYPKLRPPVYPLAIDLATAGTDYDHNASKFEEHTPISDTSEPLMRVSRLQKVFLFACGIVLTIALSYTFGLWTMPLHTLILLWLYQWEFFPLEIDYILVEAMAQGWLFLIFSAMLAFFHSGKKTYILLTALLVSLVYLTRSASVYTGILLLAVVFWALLKGFQKYWKTIAISAVLSLLLVMLPVLSRYLQTGVFALSPQYASASVLFAIEVAQPEDIDLMPDEISREFLSRSLNEREIQNERIREAYPTSEKLQYFNRMASNVWYVAYPVAGELTSSSEEQEELMYRSSKILMEKYKKEYIDIGVYALQMTANDISRLRLENPPSGLWPIMIAGLILCILIRGWHGLAAAACLLAHFAHIIIQCFYNVPDTRHIYASEFLVILAFYILMWGIIKWINEKIPARVRLESSHR